MRKYVAHCMISLLYGPYVQYMDVSIAVGKKTEKKP